MRYVASRLEGATLAELQSFVSLELKLIETALAELTVTRMQWEQTRLEPRHVEGIMVWVTANTSWNGQTLQRGLWVWNQATLKWEAV